jgi:hypothetical protein
MGNLTDIINQLESLKCHVEDMLDSEDSIWQKDAEALTVAIDIINKLNDGYKLCRINEALEVIGQLAWKNHSKYGADVISLNDVTKILKDYCKLNEG